MTFSVPGGPTSRELYGAALWDYHRGDHAAALIVHSTLGEHETLPVSVFFREPADFFPFERIALGLCRGRVLDVGAGAGVHSLVLQDRGLAVQALEVVPQALEILRARGVRNVREGSIFNVDAGSFDTVLMMMNGVGPVGDLEGLDAFLDTASRLLAPGGQILVDSAAPRNSGDAPTRDDLTLPDPPADGYPGEAWIQLEYRGGLGSPFQELYVDEDLLAERAARAGWLCSFLHRDSYGSYLAQLMAGWDRELSIQESRTSWLIDHWFRA